MSDEDKILGMTGPQQLPFEYQKQQQQTLRKRQMAQLLMQQAMKPARPNERFGRYTSNNDLSNGLTSAVQMYFANKGMSDADSEDGNLARQVGEAQTADRTKINDLRNGRPGELKEQQGPVQPGETLPPIEMGAVKPDPKAAIAAAMASRFGNIQAIGAQMQKERQAQILEQAKMIGQADPVAGVRHMQGGDPMAPVAPLVQPAPTFGTDPAGNAYSLTTDAKGTKPILSYAPKPLTVTNDIRMGNEINGDAAKYFNYGGKGFDKVTSAVQNLRNTQSLLATMDQNPTMGAGAGGIQFIRKWAQTLGAPVNEATTPTEMASMQLGQKTLDRLGGLGAQVSDADRKFMLETQGSLTNDPEAVRRMILLEAKYTMEVLNQHNQQAEELAARLPQGTVLPAHKFSLQLGQRNADDLERLFGGQGFAPAPVAPRPPPAGRGRRIQ